MSQRLRTPTGRIGVLSWTRNPRNQEITVDSMGPAGRLVRLVMAGVLMVRRGPTRGEEKVNQGAVQPGKYVSTATESLQPRNESRQSKCTHPSHTVFVRRKEKHALRICCRGRGPEVRHSLHHDTPAIAEGAKPNFHVSV